MNKNRKLIALLCAISMIFSVFASFTIFANADEITKGIVLEYDSKNSTSTKAVVNVKAVGFTALGSYNVAITAPEGATGAKATYELMEGVPNFADGVYYNGASSVNAKEVPADGVFMTVEFTLPSGGLESASSVALTDGATIADDDVELVYGGTGDKELKATSVVIPTDPSATPAPTAKARPEFADDPKPEVKEPVDVEKGIVLEYDSENSTSTKAVIDVKAVGFTSLGSYNVAITAPEGATGAKATYELMEGVPNFADGVYYNGASSVNAKEVPADGVFMTVEFTLPSEGLVADSFCQVTTGATIADDDVELVYGGTGDKELKAAWVTVPASESTFKNDKDLSDLLPKADTVIGDDDTDTNSPYYAVVTATKKDGSDAEYGTDYVAYYGDTKLTEGQLTNYLAGKYGPVKDAINNIRFEYNDGVTIAVELDKDGVDTVLDSGATKTTSPGKSTPTPKPTPTPTMSIVTTVGGKVTNKVTEKSILTATVDVPYEIRKDGAYILKEIDVDKDGYLEPISSEVENNGRNATFKFQALKAGKVTLTAYYVEDVDDNNDTNLTATKTKTNIVAKATTTVQITKEPDSSPSSPSDKSTSSGGGAIALGNQKGTTGNYPGTTTNFPDIEGVASWAGPAITRLAAEGIVAGRDDGTFDPDANITRAEYCQMLVQTINKSGVYADVNYDDVPTDAWFYHAVAVASSLGIVEGFGDNTFHPYELITREQMARMTMAATQVQGIYLNSVQSVSFSDDADIADWSRDSVYTLAEAGVINGMDDGSYFAPRANATRAQAAVIIYKAFFEGK